MNDTIVATTISVNIEHNISGGITAVFSRFHWNNDQNIIDHNCNRLHYNISKASHSRLTRVINQRLIDGRGKLEFWVTDPRNLKYVDHSELNDYCRENNNV